MCIEPEVSRFYHTELQVFQLAAMLTSESSESYQIFILWTNVRREGLHLESAKIDSNTGQSIVFYFFTLCGKNNLVHETVFTCHNLNLAS